MPASCNLIHPLLFCCRCITFCSEALSLQELTRLQESDSGLDSPRADSDYDLAGSELSSPELLQVLIPLGLVRRLGCQVLLVCVLLETAW